MSTAKKSIVKKTASTTNVNATSAKKKTVTAQTKESNNSAIKNAIVKLNLGALTDKIKDIAITERKEKDSIYVYPDAIAIASTSNEIARKKFRASLRNKMQRFCANIFVFAKSQQDEKLLAECALFDVHYKANYRLNDYSLKSVSQSNNELKTGDINTMMQIIKEVKAQHEKQSTKGAKQTKK